MNLHDIQIYSERLSLRKLRLSDSETMFKYRSDPEISRFQGWKPQTLQEVNDFISKKISRIVNIENTWYQLGVFLMINEQVELIGDIGIHFFGDGKQSEIGFTLSPKYQGMGYATEAVSAVLNYLFCHLNKHRVIASVDPENIKSIALLERLGMRKEGHFKKSIWLNEKWADDIIYAILKEEWTGNYDG